MCVECLAEEGFLFFVFSFSFVPVGNGDPAKVWEKVKHVSVGLP